MFTTSFTLALNFTPKPLTVGLALVTMSVCVSVCVCVCEKERNRDRESELTLRVVKELFTSLEEISIMCMPRRQPRKRKPSTGYRSKPEKVEPKIALAERRKEDRHNEARGVSSAENI